MTAHLQRRFPRSKIALAAWLSLAVALAGAWGVVIWAASNVLVLS